MKPSKRSSKAKGMGKVPLKDLETRSAHAVVGGDKASDAERAEYIRKLREQLTETTKEPTNNAKF